MGSIIPCATNCGEQATLPDNYKNCTTPAIKKKYGNSVLGFMTCNTGFDDATSATEWGTKITAGDIKTAPRGIIKISPGNASSTIIDGLGSKAIGNVTYTIDFETYWFSPLTADSKYFDDLFTNYDLKRVFWMEDAESNNITVNKEWRTEIDRAFTDEDAATLGASTPIGFSFSFTQIPSKVEGENGLAKWTMQLEIVTQEVLQEVQLPGVPPLLIAA